MRVWIGLLATLWVAGIGCNAILGNGEHELASHAGNEFADAEGGSQNGTADADASGNWDGTVDANGNKNPDGNGDDGTANRDSAGDGSSACDSSDAATGCTADCVPYATRCAASSQTMVQTCDVTGHWAAAFPCTFVCDDATQKCGGQCAPGTPDRCAGNTVQTCKATGQWTTLTNCVTIPCSGGACRACALGEKQCNAGKPQTCNAAGAWVDDQASACPFVCDAATGKCAGVCSPATPRCNGSNAQTCGTNGQWGSDMACAFGCNMATGVCNTCTDDPLSTTCMGNNCGPTVNNCGRTVQCPTACPGTGQTCGGGGTAGVCGCTPETDKAICTRLGKTCGSVAGTDNCGGSRTAACGTCTGPMVCEPTAGPAPNTCCMPETDPAFCARLGKNCGPLAGTDNCGNARMASCGSCTLPQTCGGGNTPRPNVCGCTGETDAMFCTRLTTACGPLTGTDNCGAPRTVSNCGGCSANQVCSTGQCLLAPGALCATGSQCGSGVCGGRCCQPNVACTCPQPSAQNLLANPGFDSSLSSWTTDVGAGGYSWQPNSPADGNGIFGDATSCPFSGSAYLAAPSGSAIQRIWQCVPVSPGANYNFGVRIHTNGGAYAYCGVDLYPGGGCTGTSTSAATGSWINVYWSIDLSTNFNTGIYSSARVSCYVDASSSQGAFYADLIYLTPAPGAY